MGTHTRVRELLTDYGYEPLHIRPCTTRDRTGVIALWNMAFDDNPDDACAHARSLRGEASPEPGGSER